MTGADWEALARFAQRRKRRLAAYFDAGCGVCFQIVRVWARLDRLGRITFRSSADLASPTPETDADGGSGRRGVTPELLARTLVVVDEVTGKTYTRADAVAQVLRALPGGLALVAAAAAARPARARQLGLRSVRAPAGVDLDVARAGRVRRADACGLGAPRADVGRRSPPAKHRLSSMHRRSPTWRRIVLPSPAVVAPLAATASPLAVDALAGRSAAGRIAAGRPRPAARGRSRPGRVRRSSSSFAG